MELLAILCNVLNYVKLYEFGFICDIRELFVGNIKHELVERKVTKRRYLTHFRKLILAVVLHT